MEKMLYLYWVRDENSDCEATVLVKGKVVSRGGTAASKQRLQGATQTTGTIRETTPN